MQIKNQKKMMRKMLWVDLTTHNMEKKGYMGKILWVDLTTHEFREEYPPDEIYKAYFGGYGLGVYYLYTHLKPHCDPLGPDNILGFCPGLFTGTVAPFTGRWMVVGKSPLTGKGIIIDEKMSNGGWGDANAGGYFGPTIRRAGYDAIFITGSAKSPCYIFLDNAKREILDASEIWGQDVSTTEKILKEKHGKPAQSAVIGKSGEKISLIAGIVNDGGRIAARSGLGAVMGSKNLKAICINASQKVTIADPKVAGELAKNYREILNHFFKSKFAGMVANLMPNLGSIYRRFKLPLKGTDSLMAKIYHEMGTSSSTSISSETGDMPIQNLKGVGFIDFPQNMVQKFSGKTLLQYKKKSYGCFGCPIQCGAILSIPEIGLEETHRPEYETLACFGGLILNPDPIVMFQANEYLNQVGMDSISAGGVVAFVLECVENGILTQEDFKCKKYPEGFLPVWNKSDYILPLLELMVNREGIGNILADGVYVAALKIGKGSEQYAMMANGQELPMHDARHTKGLALTYLTDPTPGRHTAAGIDFANFGPINKFVQNIVFTNSKDPFEKGKYQAEYAKFKQSFNALGFCEFSQWMGRYPLFELLKAVFDWDLTPEDVFQVGHRIQTLRQMFNAREGAIRHEAPGRVIGDPPMTKGPVKGISLDLELMAKGYYSAIGFQDNGIPLAETLKQLNMEFCLDDLKNCNGLPIQLINHSLHNKTAKTSSISSLSPLNELVNSKNYQINLAGYFEGHNINETYSLEFIKSPNLMEILGTLNINLKMKLFSKTAIEQNKISIMVNGNRVEADSLETQYISPQDVVTIVQPIYGG
jgi:aldehyde:ferredoxin oxidoreductase